MANTELSEIYDLMMMQVTDYRLTELFNTSEQDFETYMEGWLEYAIGDFYTVCNQDLDFDCETKMFSVTLDRKNKIILATLMARYWLQKCVSDITQFQLHITDRDFKVASEAMNLREKSAYLISIKEQCSQMLNDYSYHGNDWDNWYNQDFGGT